MVQNGSKYSYVSKKCELNKNSIGATNATCATMNTNEWQRVVEIEEINFETPWKACFLYVNIWRIVTVALCTAT